MRLLKQWDNLSFSYNASDMRTRKGDTYYELDGSNIISETTYGNTIRYYYNGTELVGFRFNGSNYYYEKNPHGDITAIYNSDGILFGAYIYDAWGNCTITTNIDNIAGINPFRYRSYYYDCEIGLYYLKARYYDPTVGRFINSDSVMPDLGASLEGYNLFSYCLNNPVNMSDSQGNWPNWSKLVGGALLAAVGVLTVAAVVATGGTCLPLVAAGYAVLGTAGTAATVVGVSEVAESFTGTNAVRDYVGNEAYAALTEGSIAVMSMGSSIISYGTSVSVCFVAGTQVLTDIGNVAIETIKPGDMVWAEDPDTGKKALKRVARTFVNETTELVHVFVNGEEIVSTPEHPYYVTGKGWVGAAHLKAGDELILQNGSTAIIDKIQNATLKFPIAVYNFEVKDFHTYFVGINSVLVHNTCGNKHYSTKRAAMRGAKRDVNIPMSQKPNEVNIIKMTDSNGRIVFAIEEVYGNNFIRNDLGGHLFRDGATLPAHFNNGTIDQYGARIQNNIHYFYK